MLREARRLGIPVIFLLLTNALDSRFSKDASIVIHVPGAGDEKGKRRYMVRYCCVWK